MPRRLTQAERSFAVAPVLAAPNPFAAAQGFGVLVERDASLLDADIAGAVAVGGDLTFGASSVAPAESATTIDTTPVGALVGGRLVADTGEARLEVAGGELLIGDLGDWSPAAGADALELRAVGAGPDTVAAVSVGVGQAADGVRAPGLFQQVFAGVFDDLRARSAALGALPATLQATDADGAVLTSYDAAAVVLRPTDGPAVWTVSAADLAVVQSISVDPAPSVSSPLIINVTGDAAELSATVTVDQAAADAILWNAPTATTVAVSGSLVGSLLAPAAAVTLGADLRGSLIAASLAQKGATVTPVTFAADVPNPGADQGIDVAGRVEERVAARGSSAGSGRRAAGCCRRAGDRRLRGAARDRQQRGDHRQGGRDRVSHQQRHPAGRGHPAAVRRNDRPDDAGGRHLGNLRLRRRRRLFVRRPNTQTGAVRGEPGPPVLGGANRLRRELVRQRQPC